MMLTAPSPSMTTMRSAAGAGPWARGREAATSAAAINTAAAIVRLVTPLLPGAESSAAQADLLGSEWAMASLYPRPISLVMIGVARGRDRHGDPVSKGEPDP